MNRTENIRMFSFLLWNLDIKLVHFPQYMIVLASYCLIHLKKEIESFPALPHDEVLILEMFYKIKYAT